ncbi:hypothetical protein CKO11_15030 [Rhodobacter sp. TJ_12]|uniref:DUF3108 domain-containing protein n=1 Tax=Rhodobacter sp. TJ_12 TaxID=2029399 RepID=UPI001CBAE064|nr:DUF3108 domain-containing protein [Rhodobacter sp. TJ_12]MBZ4023765.1 hypothetical protein [Rhodobacter sp. TJ_12]
MNLSSRLLTTLVILGALSQPVTADQTDHIAFDVLLKGIKAGELVIDGKIQGNRYGVIGVMQTTGLAAALKKIRYDASADGTFSRGVFRPRSTKISARRGESRSKNAVIYKGGVPASVIHEPPRAPRPNDVDPAKQGGTIDPLTALYAVLRDVDRDEACKLKVVMFDGTKRSQVALSTPQAAGDGVICAGEYRRLAGFSDKDMAEKTRFPFTLTYAPTPDGQRLQVVEISTDTILGKGRLKRR